MKITRFSLNREYDICCKLFTPDDEAVKSIIIGAHGFAGDKESSVLDKLAEAVCCKNTALICFDLPSHGESPVGEEMLTVENCKKDLCAVTKYITEKYPYADRNVFATSFGGYIALLCAEELKGFRLVLRAPAVTMPKVLVDNVLKISAEDFEKAATVRCGFERPLDLPFSFYSELTRQENLLEKKISSPMLVIHGDCDDIVPLEDIRAFAAGRENFRLEIIHGADHRFKKNGETEKIIELTTAFMGI